MHGTHVAVVGSSFVSNHAMFASANAIYEFTHKSRYSAQARVLRSLGLKFTQRPDGSIALRQEELDAHTLSKAAVASKAKRQWRMDLSHLNGNG